MSNTLFLSKNHYIGQGNARTCYIHPNDSSKIIKIQKKDSTKQQNKIEAIYYSDLIKNNIEFTHLAKYYTQVMTNKGQGLVFEHIQNYDGSKAQSFEDVIRKKLLSQDEQLKLMKELENYLFTNKILFIDVSLPNILCKKIDRNSYRLIIIDGLGARRPGLKFFLQRKINYLKEKKIKKQWSKFMQNYQKALAL